VIFLKIQWKKLIICVLIPLAVGGLSAWLTRNSMESFDNLTKPPLSPPGWLFPVVWSILFVLMGIASYLVLVSDKPARSKTALTVYGIQLAFNFFWSIIFFNFEMYLFAFIWLMILWLLIILTTVLFWRIDKRAGYLMLPYLVWVTFAAYLNFGIYLLN
jgi:tryptophan-rich sensory protein